MSETKRQAGAVPKTFESPPLSTTAQDHDDNSDPLDHRLYDVEKNGIITRVGGVHTGWVERRCYVSLRWPPCDRNQLTVWLRAVEFLRCDLLWLLALPYHRFWSHLVYDTSLTTCLDECLRHLPRAYELPLLPNRVTVEPRLTKIAALVLRVLLRMSTYKESSHNHMTPLYFGRLVYDCLVWHSERIFDACALFEPSNGSLMGRLLASLFTHQPNYWQDMRSLAAALPELFSRVESEVAAAETQAGAADYARVTTTLRCVTDVGWSLRALLTCYSTVAETLLQAGLAVRVASFYDAVVPRLRRRLAAKALPECVEFTVDEVDITVDSEICTRLLRLARNCLLGAFRLIVEHACLRHVSEDNDNTEACIQEHAERFLETLSDVLSEQTFVEDYNTLYPVLVDLELIGSRCSSVDPERLSYIANIITPQQPNSSAKSDRESPELDVELSESHHVPDNPDMAGMSAAQIQSLISSVRDLLPNLGDGFVEACLRYYDFDSEQVINAVLEDSLPEQLARLDRTAASIRQSPGPVSNSDHVGVFQATESNGVATNSEETVPNRSVQDQSVSPKVAHRRNIFDGDEYDIFSKSTGQARLAAANYKRGKLGRRQRLVEELADRSEVRSDQRYQLFGSLACEGSVYESNLYEDEYDDTYDDSGPLTGVAADGEEKDVPIRQITLNQALPSTRWCRRSRSSSSEGSLQEQDSEADDTEKIKRISRVTDENRRRLERNIDSRGFKHKAAEEVNETHLGASSRKTPNSGYSRPRGGAHRGGGKSGTGSDVHDPSTPTHSRDVVGAPRGHGQSNRVIHNRRLKTVHKSSTRSRGHDRKYRGGMF